MFEAGGNLAKGVSKFLSDLEASAARPRRLGPPSCFGGYNLKLFKDFRTENGSNQGQNLALTVLIVPNCPASQAYVPPRPRPAALFQYQCQHPLSSQLLGGLEIGQFEPS